MEKNWFKYLFEKKSFTYQLYVKVCRPLNVSFLDIEYGPRSQKNLGAKVINTLELGKVCVHLDILQVQSDLPNLPLLVPRQFWAD